MSFSILEAARDCGSLPALIHDGLTLSFEELSRRVGARLRQLEAAGGAGDRPIAFVAEPTPDAVSSLLALVEARVPAVPLHPRWSEAERDAMLRETGAALWTGGQLARDESVPAPRWPAQARPLALLRTSGSTGAGKVALMNERSFISACDASARRLGWHGDDRWLLALPFAHVGGLSLLLRCLRARRAVVLGEATLALLARERVTIASFVPTQLARLLHGGERPPPSLRIALVGGGPCTPELARRARALSWPIRLTYGLTETCAQVATQAGDEPADDASCGPPLDGCELRVSGGVLEVRSPTLFAGYWREGTCLRATDEDGWFRTGDLGRIDHAGRVHVLGRLDEAIITGGEKVAPGTVESAVARATGAQFACAFGVDDAEWGQRVAVVVQSDEPWDSLAARLASGLEELSPYERPGLLAVLAKLPLATGGKLDRRRLRAACEKLLRPLRT